MVKIIESLTGIGELASKSKIVFSHGQDEFLFDSAGREYLDFGSGNMAVPFGHNNRKIMSRVQKALGKVWNVQDFMTEEKLRSLQTILEFLPDHLTDVVFHTSGTEGVESLRRAVISYTKRYAFIVFQKAFHGYTLGSRNLGPALLKGYGPLPGNTIQVPAPSCGACPWGKQVGNCEAQCFESFTSSVDNQSPECPAAFLFEPVLGAAGVIVPPEKYYQKAGEYCRKNNIMIACDEILTGLGRTGRKFGFEHTGLEPDIIVFAKGLGNGLPVICVAGRREIMRSSPYSFDGWNTTSFGGNPISWTAAAASLSFYGESISQDDLVRKEGIMRSFLHTLRERYPEHLEIRGIGMLWALEFKGFRDNSAVGNHVAFKLLHQGIRLNDSFNIVRLTPPLIISEDSLVKGMETIAGTVEKSFRVLAGQTS